MTTCKPCESCGEPFAKRPNEGARWEKRRACSPTCAAALRRKVEEKACQHCGNNFMPQRRSAKYCGRQCSAAAHAGPAPTKGKPERYRRVTLPDGTRELEHRVVMEQKLGRPLVTGENVHHKNGDRFDNDPLNLELWYRSQPAGQRVADLIAYVAKYHADAVQRQLLSNLCGEPAQAD